MVHGSNSNLSREERRIELEQISRGKNGMLELHRQRHIACGNKAGSMPFVRANDDRKFFKCRLHQDFMPKSP